MQLPWPGVPQLSTQVKEKGKGAPLTSLIEKDLLTFFILTYIFQ